MSKDLKKNYEIAKIITPLLEASLIKKKELKMLLEKVTNAADEVLETSKIYKDLSNKDKNTIRGQLIEIFSLLLSTEVIYNDTTYLEDAKEELIYVLDKMPLFFKNIQIDDKELEDNVQNGLAYIFKELYSFHNILYLSNYITLDEFRSLILKNTAAAIKSTMLIINVIKEQNTENLYLNSFNFKLSGYIYSIGLSSLFEYLVKEEEKIIDYLENHEKYIKKIEKTFFETYSVMTRTTKIITEKIKK